jgi:GH35 family endo-1,4-beta-xylanase
MPHHPTLSGSAAAALAATALLGLPTGTTARPLTEAEIIAAYGRAPVRPLSLRATPEFMASAAANATLRDAAVAAGIRMGSTTNAGTVANVSEPLYVPTFLAQYDSSVAENSCKFGATEPGEGTFTFQDCTTLAELAIVNGSGVFRGHNTVWGESIPGWVTGGKWSPDQLQSIMTTHISKVVGNYAGQFLWCVRALMRGRAARGGCIARRWALV